MALDASLLDQAKAAEARVIDADHEAEVARTEFHRAVRCLQLAGDFRFARSPTRSASATSACTRSWSPPGEAAVGGRRRDGGKLECSFCGRDQNRHTKALIGGPGVYICDRCIPRARAAALAIGAAATSAAGRSSRRSPRRPAPSGAASAGSAAIGCPAWRRRGASGSALNAWRCAARSAASGSPDRAGRRTGAAFPGRGRRMPGPRPVADARRRWRPSTDGRPGH